MYLNNQARDRPKTWMRVSSMPELINRASNWKKSLTECFSISGHIHTKGGCVHVCKCLYSTFMSLTHGFVGYVHTCMSAHAPSVRSFEYEHLHKWTYPVKCAHPLCVYTSAHTQTIYTAEIHNIVDFCVYTLAHAPHKLTRPNIVCAWYYLNNFLGANHSPSRREGCPPAPGWTGR